MAPLKRSESNAIRFAMYRHLESVFATLPNFQKGSGGLSISGSGHLARLLSSHATITNADYPDYNMLELPFENDQFDFVVSDQVLEHVGGDPFQAIGETYRVLKPGGIAVHTTVLLFQIHGYPNDYWRFTPEGLKLLCRNFSKIIDSGGWGNRYLWAMNWLGVLYDENVPLAQWHPFHKIAVLNEERYPAVTWIVAQK